MKERWMIFPLRKHNIQRLITRGAPTYIKYPIRAPTNKHPLPYSPGDYSFFYVGGDKTISHYGVITSVQMYMPSDAKKIIDRTQMTKKEIIEYTGDRQSKVLFALEFEQILPLTKAFSPKHPVSMTGRFVKKDEMPEIQALMKP